MAVQHSPHPDHPASPTHDPGDLLHSRARKAATLVSSRLKRRPPRLDTAVYHAESEWNRHIYCWTPATLLTLMAVNGFEYETHSFATEPASVPDRLVHRVVPFVGAVLILKVRKREAAPGRLV